MEFWKNRRKEKMECWKKSGSSISHPVKELVSRLRVRLRVRKREKMPTEYAEKRIRVVALNSQPSNKVFFFFKREGDLGGEFSIRKNC
jgi:hypothetical protein